MEATTVHQVPHVLMCRGSFNVLAYLGTLEMEQCVRVGFAKYCNCLFSFSKTDNDRPTESRNKPYRRVDAK